MTFRFRLQRLLELREQSEQAKSRELNSARDAADHARVQHESLASKRAHSLAEIGAVHAAQPLVGQLQQSGYLISSLDERLNSASDTLSAADATVDAAQRALSDAALARHVLDRLKERHTNVWRSQESQRDRLTMDELALSRHSQRSKTDPKHADVNDGAASQISRVVTGKI